MKRTVTTAPISEDWSVLLSFLPENWKDLAADTGALRGLRKDKSPEMLLPTSHFVVTKKYGFLPFPFWEHFFVTAYVWD